MKTRINTNKMQLYDISLYYTKNRQACTTICKYLNNENFLEFLFCTYFPNIKSKCLFLKKQTFWKFHINYSLY
nr:MAG TPA: hypothetical protein [Bacteriophage sp.]